MHVNLLAATLSAITLITGLSAQTQTRSDFIQGQDVTLGVTQAPPGVVVLHWLGFSGLGKGTCIPKPFDVCFDIPGSLILLATGVSDAQGRHELTFRVPVDAPLIRVASQQLLLDVTTLATTKTNAIDGPIDTIGALDDDFLGSSLSPVWTVLDATRQTYSVANSELRMRPTKTGITAIWYQDDEGPFVYRHVRGDFTVETKLSVVDPTQPTYPPAPTCRVGGLMVRNPASSLGKQNWVYLLMGGGIPTIPAAIEDKSTVDSKSVFSFLPVGFWSGKLRIQRRGRAISLWYQEVGKTTWALLRTHDRPDFPDTLQVGLVVFSLDAPPQVEARFDTIRFSK